MKIYVASSWRNPRQQEVVRQLRRAGHEVFDFREHPTPTPSWGDMGYGPENYRRWTGKEILDALDDARSKEVFDRDMAALQAADATILVMPCGRSAHLELGYAVGQGQKTAVLVAEDHEPEIMQLMADLVTPHMDSLKAFLNA